ncbi:hypothetical protein DMI65_13540 [Escherichia coli]|nr:hypothetical protein [Escherichia coli]
MLPASWLIIWLFCVTRILVAFNWEPLTASVLVVGEITSRNVGDFAGIAIMAGVVGTCVFIPQQRVIIERIRASPTLL